jgi:hypothetical protein
MSRLSLDGMIRMAGEHARNILIQEKQDSLRPVFLFQSGGGEIGIIAGAIDMDDADQKQALADSVRVILRERGAVAYSFLSEAWMARQPADQPLPRNVRDNPERIEIVYAVAFDAAGESRSMVWRITRGPDGQITDLTQEAPLPGPMAGRFANLLQSLQ